VVRAFLYAAVALLTRGLARSFVPRQPLSIWDAPDNRANLPELNLLCFALDRQRAGPPGVTL
jgi:hypothetical protein